ncbi:M3 family metallopeptidase [Shewanella sairae]|uniref:M3 family metallopeptidase n=1 Tax=Shewanella sairae TaxID=190310 RepID=UPI001FE42BF2|nr:M3 family metallopeptidase [Shewanella sairae]MCL1130172.1 M3 family metallopeptidase [Shewanella sairae]
MWHTPKSISVPTANLRQWLLKPAIWCLFCFNTAAYAAVSPIPLLVEQCLNYQFPTKSNLDNQANKPNENISFIIENEAIALERNLIGFFNINDRLKYYRHFPLTYADRERVLQCQLYLADELALFFKSAEFQSIRFKLAASQDPNIQALAKRINRLAKNTEKPYDKAQLHTAQATFKQGVSSQSLSLNFIGERCKLDQTAAITEQVTTEQVTPQRNKSFNDSLASYLIKQPNEQCRKQVWQAYQGRASVKNHTALMQITELRQQQATQAGFTDYVDTMLSQQWLAEPSLVAKFLDAQTQAINIAPWDLGQLLAKAQSTKVESYSSKLWLQQIGTVLETLGIRFSEVNPKLYRIYHEDRLIGEVYVNLGKRIKAKAIRHTVVGQQFGQFELTLLTDLNQYKTQSQVINVIAQIVSQLASGDKYYLNNTLGETQDSAQIDLLWLQTWLKAKLLPTPTQGSREAILQRYSAQLQVFRAKVALNTYLAADSTNKFDLNKAFTLAFGKNWDNISDSAYSFSAIVYQGPIYYQNIWQQAVANDIYQSTKDCQNQKRVFNNLVVNETASDLATRLQLLLGEPITSDSLIKRTQYAFNHQDQHPRSCTFLRQ